MFVARLEEGRGEFYKADLDDHTHLVWLRFFTGNLGGSADERTSDEAGGDMKCNVCVYVLMCLRADTSRTSSITSLCHGVGI